MPLSELLKMVKKNEIKDAKTVIGLGFRVLRGSYRCIEEGTTYYQYTTNAVETIEEVVIPYTLVCVSNVIEDNGFIAVPQRRNQTIMKEENSTNPEVDYTDIFRGITIENQIDFMSHINSSSCSDRYSFWRAWEVRASTGPFPLPFPHALPGYGDGFPYAQCACWQSG